MSNQSADTVGCLIHYNEMQQTRNWAALTAKMFMYVTQPELPHISTYEQTGPGPDTPGPITLTGAVFDSLCGMLARVAFA